MFDLAALLRALHDRDLEYVAVGGVAVGAHGYIRTTEDLDIVPNPTVANHMRLAGLLTELEATLPTASGRRFDRDTDLAALRRGRNLSLETRHGSLDVIQSARGVPPYATLAQAASAAELLGTAVEVCSLEHLREMKAATARSQDLADLDNLPMP